MNVSVFNPLTILFYIASVVTIIVLAITGNNGNGLYSPYTYVELFITTAIVCVIPSFALVIIGMTLLEKRVELWTALRTQFRVIEMKISDDGEGFQRVYIVQSRVLFPLGWGVWSAHQQLGEHTFSRADEATRKFNRLCEYRGSVIIRNRADLAIGDKTVIEQSDDDQNHSAGDSNGKTTIDRFDRLGKDLR